jgi:hypothetical protein
MKEKLRSLREKVLTKRIFNATLVRLIRSGDLSAVA